MPNFNNIVITDTNNMTNLADTQPLRAYIQRIATGPHMSKDLTLEEARHGMKLILETAVDPVQAAIFFIALRMKRETDAENQGILQAMRENAQFKIAQVPELVDLTDPFDGFLRHVPASPFVPAVLAACGLPTISHGVESMGPKYGVTHRHILRAAGFAVDLTPAEAVKRLENPKIGWAYLDQSAYAPDLYALTELRTRMVKRPCITTLEVLTGPVRSPHRNYLVTGYVHKPYREIYLNLARASGYAAGLVIRGIEGGILPSLRSTSNIGVYQGDAPIESLEIDPTTIAIQQNNRAALIPEALFKPPVHETADPLPDIAQLAQWSATCGLAALKGEHGPSRDSLILSSALILWQFGKANSLMAAAQMARNVLDSGLGLAHFEHSSA